MRIQITNLQHEGDGRFKFGACLGKEQIVGHLTESNEDIESFNFDETFFDVLFAHDGLGLKFNQDFWAFRNGFGRPFPWDYGDHNEQIIHRALEESKTKLDSLR